MPVAPLRRFVRGRTLACLGAGAAWLLSTSVALADDPPATSGSGDSGDPTAAPSPSPAPPAEASPPPEPAPGPQEFTPTADGPRTKPVELRYNLWVDGAITLGLGVGVLTWGFLKADFPNRTCTICDGPRTEINGFDDFWRSSFKADNIDTPATISHVVSYGVSPAVGVAMTIGVAAADRRIKEAPVNALLVVEASLAAVVAKEALTFAIRRERPQVHALEGDAKRQEIEKQSDPLESFPGGHTASIMAITASSAVIATMRGYRWAPLIWVVGSAMAGFVTVLRVASDQHYMTDNLVGVVLGGGIGAAVPLLFHRPVRAGDPTSTTAGRRPMLSTTAVPGGRVVNVGFTF
jgi:membrane-associated phospholipid phosphatase